MNDRITIEGRDGAFGAYIALPKALPAPAVVVLRRTSRTRLHCGSARPVLASGAGVTSEADWQPGLRLYQAYDRDAGAKDVKDNRQCRGQIARVHRRRQPSPTGGLASFYINNCGDLRCVVSPWRRPRCYWHAASVTGLCAPCG
jgi:hypothetical protein